MDQDVRQVVTIVLSGAVLLNAAVFVLLFFEQIAGGTLAREAVLHEGLALRPEFLEIWFEAVSALGTVGLSTGITSMLSGPSQVVVIFLMFLGRVGPLTAAMAMMQRGTGARYRYPEEKILVG
jgi:Trk-type K+ transport system membrane component